MTHVIERGRAYAVWVRGNPFCFEGICTQSAERVPLKEGTPCILIFGEAFEDYGIDPAYCERSP